MELEQEHKDVLEEHLPYELDMLEEALSRWGSLPKEPDFFRRNSTIETFWVHARNIHEFFQNKQTNGRTAAANKFTTKSIYYEFKEFGNKIQNIHDQIAHLNYSRPRTAEQKLDLAFARRVKEAIDRAVGNFQANLRPEATRYWRTRSAKQIASVSELALNSSHTTSLSKTVGFNSR
ncbi:MAG: hypothetical protein WB822_02700 [Rhodoplanes sp.]